MLSLEDYVTGHARFRSEIEHTESVGRVRPEQREKQSRKDATYDADTQNHTCTLTRFLIETAYTYLMALAARRK